VAKYRVPGCIFKTWNMRENKKRVDAGERDRERIRGEYEES
jgi:hypothetical protein